MRVDASYLTWTSLEACGVQQPLRWMGYGTSKVLCWPYLRSILVAMVSWELARCLWDSGSGQ